MSTMLNLTPAGLKHELDAGDVVLIDIREPVEHAHERIPGARLIPLGELSSERLASLHSNVVLYCRTGRRSTEALHLLAGQGFTRAAHLEGGIESWKSEGLATERTAGAPRLSLMQQVQVTAGSLVVAGTALGAFLHPGWLFLSGFVGAGLVFSGATGSCAMAALLSKLPWNRVAGCAVK